MSKYWEEEKAVIFQTDGQELRYFQQAGKLQIYARREGGNGVTKGVVVDLGTSTAEDLTQLIAFMMLAVSDHLEEDVDTDFLGHSMEVLRKQYGL